jgi:hypothetical protein
MPQDTSGVVALAIPTQQGVRATTRPWQRQRALDISWYTRGEAEAFGFCLVSSPIPVPIAVPVAALFPLLVLLVRQQP